jgi:hypothetical protein
MENHGARHMADQLTRYAILSADDRPLREVSVPEWGGSLFVRMMTAGERDAFEASQGTDPHRDLRARLAVATVCDGDGQLLFAAADVPALTAKSGRALDRIFAAAARHNGITAADVEELRKNS